MTDSITAWLNNAARYELLTAEQTIELGRKIQAAEEGSPERIKLINKLCQHNLRLVAKFTRAYMKGSTRKLTWGGDETMDLLQEGYFGLRRAASKFDPERGYTFATYANAWVRQAIGKYHVDKLSLIRVPESSAREIFYYDTHGKPRNEKTSPWVADAASAARAAYGLVSYDNKLADEEHSLIDLLSEENRIVDERGEINYDRYNQLMEDVGIDDKVRAVIISYCKRGNLDTAMMKNKLPMTRVNRAKVRGAIEQIKAHCGQ
jgi:RNA polymerase sigma factor (sigma-70 family)